MTTPKMPTAYSGGSRFYVDPGDPDRKVPGVTSILNMLPKPFLKAWAAKMTAQAAVENIPEVIRMVLNGEAVGAVDWLKQAADRDVRKAAAGGTDAHEIFEALSNGEDVDGSKLREDVLRFAEHFQTFLDEVQPEFRFVERTVWHDGHAGDPGLSYAGTVDAFMVIGGELVVADWKTTRSGIHAEAGIQLAAYRFAQRVVNGDGTSEPVPPVTGAAVLHVRPEGAQLVPVRADEEVFETFLNLRRVFTWDTVAQKTIVGEPIWTNLPASARRKTRR